jgi:hypothetical protein
MKKPQQHLLNWLTEHNRIAGFQINYLEQKAGVGKTVLYGFIRGKNSVSHKSLRKLIEVFKVYGYVPDNEPADGE